MIFVCYLMPITQSWMLISIKKQINIDRQLEMWIKKGEVRG
ncbi:hypothetical protein [Aquibacillus kalidii]|nr:hypothetical protein [Aquibacillus kalidii]